MEIDRRAFLVSIGGVAAVEAMDPEARAEALEHYMMDKLDEEAARGLALVGGEAQVVAAPPEATIRRGAGNLDRTAFATRHRAREAREARGADPAGAEVAAHGAQSGQPQPA